MRQGLWCFFPRELLLIVKQTAGLRGYIGVFRDLQLMGRDYPRGLSCGSQMILLFIMVWDAEGLYARNNSQLKLDRALQKLPFRSEFNL